VVRVPRGFHSLRRPNRSPRPAELRIPGQALALVPISHPRLARVILWPLVGQALTARMLQPNPEDTAQCAIIG
jgi:hypothetical protein